MKVVRHARLAAQYHVIAQRGTAPNAGLPDTALSPDPEASGFINRGTAVAGAGDWNTAASVVNNFPTMGVTGATGDGIFAANEYLTRINLMKAYDPENYDTPMYDMKGKTAIVFGGGNTAMDAVRTSLRLGAERAIISYRRTEKEMPARVEEIHHAKEEGVEFMFLTSPLEFLGNEEGRLTEVRMQKMELGEPDDSGRRRPVPIKGDIEIIPTNVAVIAIGNGSNPIISQTTPELDVNKWGNIIVDEKTMKTNMKGIFAGGDIVTGGATVILAMGAGRVAAANIHDYLNTGKW